MAELNETPNEPNPPVNPGVADPPATGAQGAAPTPPANGGEPPAGAEGAGAPEGNAPPATAPVDPEIARRDRTINEMRRRINALTADKLRLAQAAAAQPAAQPQAGSETPPPQQAGETDAQYKARVLALADAIANQREFDRRCNEVANAGKAVHPDFLERVSDLVTIHDPHDQQSSARYNAMLDAAIEVGGADAHELVYALSGDLTEASRIMSLPPQRMGAALAKLAGAVKPQPAAVSGAPKPITPIPLGGGHENIRASDPQNAARLSSEEWHKRRQAEVEEKRAKGRRMA